MVWNCLEWAGLVWKGADDEDEDEDEDEPEAEGRWSQMFLPPTGVILGATSVYKCDKGLFAMGFCVFEVCTKCDKVCTKCVGAGRMAEPQPKAVASCKLLVAGCWFQAGLARRKKRLKRFKIV